MVEFPFRGDKRSINLYDIFEVRKTLFCQMRFSKFSKRIKVYFDISFNKKMESDILWK